MAHNGITIDSRVAVTLTSNREDDLHGEVRRISQDDAGGLLYSIRLDDGSDYVARLCELLPAGDRCDDCNAPQYTRNQRICDACYNAETEAWDEAYRARWES